ncbi:hypothetical protein [Haloferula sp. BvORR071]|uniref:hypothetical protein n=1 Tax=Haloferula sp. BvORR071 TaxID=1396141 RepID=UPI0005519F95|nr:hypothetical protein [Haloferula sp. BvORR071]
MSVLADLYVSTPDKALEYDETQQAPENERAEMTGFTAIEFSTLWAIIEGKDWDEAHMDAFETVMEKDGGDRMISLLPTKFVELSAALDEAGIAAAAEEWAQTDELEHCEPEDLRETIEELRRVARVAKESKRSLYLWNSV